MAHVPPLSSVAESCAVDVLYQLRKSLGEKCQVNFVPDVVLSSLEQIQQGLQERVQLYIAGREQKHPKSLR